MHGDTCLIGPHNHQRRAVGTMTKATPRVVSHEPAEHGVLRPKPFWIDEADDQHRSTENHRLALMEPVHLVFSPVLSRNWFKSPEAHAMAVIPPLKGGMGCAYAYAHAHSVDWHMQAQGPLCLKRLEGPPRFEPACVSDPCPNEAPQQARLTN